MGFKLQGPIVASEDLNALYNEARSFAEYMLLTYGELIPFGVQMGVDGKIVQIAGHLGTEHPKSADVVGYLQAAFAQSASKGLILAAGICLDMYVTPPGQQQKTDAICVRLAHVSGEAVEVFVPYCRDVSGILQAGESFAAAAGDFRLAEP